jgi:hypothetical protein
MLRAAHRQVLRDEPSGRVPGDPLSPPAVGGREFLALVGQLAVLICSKRGFDIEYGAERPMLDRGRYRSAFVYELTAMVVIICVRGY